MCAGKGGVGHESEGAAAGNHRPFAPDVGPRHPLSWRVGEAGVGEQLGWQADRESACDLHARALLRHLWQANCGPREMRGQQGARLVGEEPCGAGAASL